MIAATEPALRIVEGLPRCDIGAPLPTVIAAEHAVTLLYVVGQPDPGWDGTYVNVVTPETLDLFIATIHFYHPVAHVLAGFPDEETYAGHSLSRVGLKPYQMFEVINSPWAAELERIRSSN